MGCERSAHLGKAPTKTKRLLHRDAEASKSVGSNGEIVLRLKVEQAFGVGIWTFETSMSATLTPRILILPELLTYGCHCPIE